jgi:hypothetical protein
MQSDKQAIKNSTFRNKLDIGKALLTRHITIMKKYDRRITNILQIRIMSTTT